MPKQIIIAEQHRTAAVFSEDQIEEIIVATGTHQVGDIYLGVVENVLTSIDAAFVNIGDGERNGFIHITDLGPLKMRRSAGNISDLVSPQQRVLVQVMKEPTGNKGPRLTGNISLPGRYVVLIPFGRGVNLSRRIRSEAERNRLRALAILIKPSGMGLLVRTEAESMPEEQIIEDLDNLQKQWEAVQQDASTTRHPSLLDRDRDFIQKVLRDLYSDEVNRIVTDTSDGLRRVKHHLLNWADGKIPSNLSLDQHRERASILEYFRVNAAIREALRPRVDLPSGGYIIIEPTEALTVIDVNSGSFTKSQTSRETVLWTNCEAAVEVARQMRLRNIAGVIVVDFIDMDTRRDQMQLLEHFNKSLRADKSRPQIAQLTELGLVELTRKRQGQSIYELFGRPCPTCNGLGHLVHLPGDSNAHTVDSTNRQWEARLTSKLDLTSESLDDDSPLSGGIEPNLVNHPSYQERNGNSRRRKRNAPPSGRDREARETRDTEKPPAIEPRDGRLRSEPRPESRSDSRSESRAEPKFEPKFEPREAPSKVPVLSVRNTNPTQPPVEVEPEVVPQERIGRRETPRPKLDPPEVVVVEMTEEEQDIYAFMGISPLLLVDRELKDPRNTIVTVALPGMAPPVSAVEPSSPTSEDSNSSVEDLAETEENDQYDRTTAFSSSFSEEFDLSEQPTQVSPFEPILRAQKKVELVDSDEISEPNHSDDVDVSPKKEEPAIQSPAASRRRRTPSNQS
jgi:ribonuclease E